MRIAEAAYPGLDKPGETDQPPAQIMATRTDFNDEEWRHLQYVPLWVFFTVAGSDGKFDKKELMAFDKALQEALLQPEPLVRDILLATRENIDELLPESMEKLAAVDMVAMWNWVADLLQIKAGPEQAGAVKDAMLGVGWRVAAASGGFLGLGSKVSPEERLALAAIAHHLHHNWQPPA
jgi:hypothetical protein